MCLSVCPRERGIYLGRGGGGGCLPWMRPWIGGAHPGRGGAGTCLGQGVPNLAPHWSGWGYLSIRLDGGHPPIRPDGSTPIRLDGDPPIGLVGVPPSPNRAGWGNSIPLSPPGDRVVHWALALYASSVHGGGLSCQLFWALDYDG